MPGQGSVAGGVMAARRLLEPSGQGSNPCPPAPSAALMVSGGMRGRSPPQSAPPAVKAVKGDVDMGLSVVVLAAGEGKRFRPALPKPPHALAGRPLLWHVLAATAPLKSDRTVVVVGVGAEEVTAAAERFDVGPLQF